MFKPNSPIPLCAPFVTLLGIVCYYLYVHMDIEVIQICLPVLVLIGFLLAYVWVLYDRVVQAQENLAEFNKRFPPR